MQTSVDLVRIRVLYNLADPQGVYLAGELVLAPRKAAAVLVRQGLAEYAELERAVAEPPEKRINRWPF